MRILLQGGTDGERLLIARALTAAGCSLAEREGDCRDLVLTVGGPDAVVGRDGLSLDIASGIATRAGRTVRLSRTEVLLLTVLLRSDTPLGRAELLSAVWGYRFDPGTNVVAVHVSRLRAKIGADAIVLVAGRYAIGLGEAASASSRKASSAAQEMRSAAGS